MYTSRLVMAAVLVLAVSMLAAQAASAAQGMMQGMQGRGPGLYRAMGPGMMPLDELTKALTLTPDQVSKIQAIQQTSRTQRQEIMADKSLTSEARRTKMMDVIRSHHSQMMAVLTPEQQAKFQELHAQKRGERVDRWSTVLGLTADQQTRIRAIKDKERADIMAVRDDASLTREAKKARSKEIATAARKQYRSVLTPEQLAKLDAMHKSKPGRAGAGPQRMAPKAVPQF